MANAAARIRVEGAGVAELNLVAAPVGPAPTRLRRSEDFLRGLKDKDEDDENENVEEK